MGASATYGRVYKATNGSFPELAIRRTSSAPKMPQVSDNSKQMNDSRASPLTKDPGGDVSEHHNNSLATTYTRKYALPSRTRMCMRGRALRMPIKSRQVPRTRLSSGLRAMHCLRRQMKMTAGSQLDNIISSQKLLTRCKDIIYARDCHQNFLSTSYTLGSRLSPCKFEHIHMFERVCRWNDRASRNWENVAG